ncbi:MAG: TAXI family TRAP transporter solute-binding subunit [Clostridium sp.]
MKKLALLLATVMAVSSLAGCGQKAASDGPKTADANTKSENGAGGSSQGIKKYSLGSGSVGGNFYLIGGGISTAINNLLPENFMITTETTGGSTANLTMIQNGDAELGITMNSSLAEAEAGKADWTGGKPMDKLRGLIPLYPSYMTIYALKSSNINCLSDLNGKVVGLGSKGAAMDTSLRTIFEKLGITPKSIYNDGHAATASAVGDGTIDAAILFSYPPFAAVAELEATKDLTFIGMTEEEQKKMMEIYSFYTPSTLPAGSYKGLTQDINTISEWNMLVASSAVSEEEGYMLAKTLLENNDTLAAIHESCKYALAENCLKSNIPLHAGTIKYLKEVGIEVPKELYPAEYKE